ncbi:sugar transferase [Fictibacillus aquaticus]|uniref:UDP-phosphate galactose phosphotransferase n=1 Tax=Fictibacillus aquaticus TaxID=2021314 RepID=A0A235F8N4_9BACL|nr:sugar transferase [Fictibacillus aquaticus]OYD57602.1 UDP-phosphate galactose phosphotransferase [Fictibacillus aquaticus]
MYKMFIKRIIDLILAFILLPFWFLFLLIVGPCIYFQDRGSIFYIAPRLGKNGKKFNMFKFRTMYVNAPDLRNNDRSTFSSEDDLRLTKIGKLIRKTSLDETPQLLNILKGDMSFIGPRPDLPEAKEIYSNMEKKKLNVRPGVTGYNQAYYRNSATTKEKFRNDVYYVDNISLVLDLKIFFSTLKNVALRKNVFNNKTTLNSRGIDK